MPKAEQPLEKHIQTAILDWLSYNKIFAWRNNSGGFRDSRDHFYRFGLTGSADILGVLPGGRALAIEVKRPGKHPTPAQSSFLQAVNDAGGLAFVATSIEDVTTRLLNR